MFPKNAAVIGGSIAGTAVAQALSRHGHQVTVYERSVADLADRGYGVCLPVTVFQEAVTRGYLDDALATCVFSERVWITSDDIGHSQTLWRQQLPTPVIAVNWGQLLATLRRNTTNVQYRVGCAVQSVQMGNDGVSAIIQFDGHRQSVDMVIGCDGYKSVVRQVFAHQAVPDEAGYDVWRGTVCLAEIEPSAATHILRGAGVTVGLADGHVVFYLIPGRDGREYVNWVGYSTTATEVVDLCGGMPGEWAEIVRRSPVESQVKQRVLDLQLPRYSWASLAVAGDAGAISRPHTASGAMKALQDAFYLEDVFTDADSVPDALAQYSALRCEAGNDIVALGRRIGRDQVEQVPNWSAMKPELMQQWATTTVTGHNSYLYAQES